MVDVLRAHVAAQEFERNGWGDVYRDRDLVFCNPDGSPYDPDVATRRFEQRGRAARLVVIKLHEARHTHATLLLENGESLKYVAERLGDREDTVLEIYQHVTAKTRSEAPARLAALIDGTMHGSAPMAWAEQQEGD
jgi:integrase